MDGKGFMEYTISTGDRVPAGLEREYKDLLDSCGLRDERDSDFVLLLLDEEGALAATGALRGNVLKQIAVSKSMEGQGLCAKVVSELVTEAVSRGESHLFLYTKPGNESVFSDLGFCPVVRTEDIVMMENRRNGLDNFLRGLPHLEGKVGAIVCNCNPFTLGHRRLIEYSAAHCDALLVFVLSEDMSMFPADVRYQLVQQGTEDLKNVTVVRGGKYVISRATFPTYFIKKTENCAVAACELDLRLFAERIAPELHITIRFVGQEPFDLVTKQYNEKMKQELPKFGIQVCEIPRYRNISASKVRRLIAEGRVGEAEELLPRVTYDYCRRHFGAGS